MNNIPFFIELQVRDYELDIQGIVNNSVYQNYLEHARHEFLIANGIDFAALHLEGIDLVVTRIEMDYKSPLQSRDCFIVEVQCVREGNIRLAFLQSILRKSDSKLVLNAKVTGVALKQGRPQKPDSILALTSLFKT